MGGRNYHRHSAHIKQRQEDHISKKTINNDELDAATCQCNLEGLFPHWIPYMVVSLTLAFRLVYVSQPENWWIHHPDEIFQTIEVAFSEVYSYGFRTYEYLPPPHNVTSGVEQMESDMGMYSLRSFLLPDTLMLVFHLARFIGLGKNAFLVGKMFHAVISSFLPLSVFYLNKTVFRCQMIATVSCILVASSLPLTIFGTHTLVNSFTATPFLFGVGMCLSYFYYQPEKLQKHVTSSNQAISPLQTAHHSKCGKDYIHSGSQTTAKTSSLDNNEYPKKVKFYSSLGCVCVGSFLVGLTVYIRVDLCLIFGVYLAPVLIVRARGLPSLIYGLICIGVGSILGIIIGGYEDFRRYGVWFIAPLQWFKFNLRNESANLFGSSSSFKYLYAMAPDYMIMAINLICIVSIMCQIIVGDTKNNRTLNITIFYFLGILGILGLYSYVHHKEERFLHNVIVLQLTLFAASFKMAVQLLQKVRTFRSEYIVHPIILLFLVNTYQRFPNIHDGSVRRWTYQNRPSSADLNYCLTLIGQQSEPVEGVLITESIYYTGGYSALQKDVPVLVRVHFEYHLYGETRTNKDGTSPNLRIINRYSDFLHSKNNHYMSKLLLEDNQFNYIVCKDSEVSYFTGLRYIELFRKGRYVVLRRTLLPEVSDKLFVLARKIPLGNNATILEYEGSWLFNAGQYRKCAERLEYAIEINNSRIRPYQLLGMSYIELKDWKRAHEVENECFRLHTEPECMKPQSKIVINDEYRPLDV
ncbi:hypothetical protein ACJMK2_012221 [Sinanodonta woodiana]|uniref:Mannosyltransferase n=1 Tax=Sinanodonta woodiana TaxID=1069815 RepID=A0ABD3V7J0_SINWO